MGNVTATVLDLTDEQVRSFHEDGFVVVDRIVEPELARRALARYGELFDGRFETGLNPDEWNWKSGRDDPALTRQICNGWKSDRDIAAVVLREDIGRACARLGGWPGARLSQDNVLWKPAGGRALGFHQDSSYEQWADPSDWVSCWIALEDTTAAGGTVEYVRGSHRWDHWGMIEEFHGPADPDRDLRQAAERRRRRRRARAGRGPRRRGSVPRRVDMARVGSQRDGSSPPIVGGALHDVGGPVPSLRDRVHLQPLQALR